MTNLIIASCCIFTTLATNWITVSTSWDSCNVPGCTVIHYTKVKQAGFIVTNTTAEVVWNQKTNTFLLESSPPCSADKLTREISINPISPLYSQLDMLPPIPKQPTTLTNLIFQPPTTSGEIMKWITNTSPSER